VLELLSLIAVQNYHDAAHVWLDLPASAKIEYPGLNALQRSLMLLAGEQAGREGEISCTVDFWEEAMVKRDFDPHLALNLQRALMATGAYNKAVRLLTQLMSWLKQAAKQDPQTWPPARLNAALAQLYCFSADCQASLGRYAEVERSLKQAEQLAPGYPDTIGRRGLQAWLKHQKEDAISLLTQALEAGCRFPEVYRTLLEALEADTAATKPIRRKFGQYFGDLGVDSEVEIAPWIEALTYQNYGLLAETASRQQQPSPAMQALKIFVEAASSEPSSSQKVTFDHSQAIPQWEALLAASSPAEQVEVIKAIYLTVQQHAKRNQKGVAALQSNYLSKMAALSSQQLPGADVAHLMIMAMRASDKQLTAAVEAILRRATQPGNTLATAQLELRRFGPSGSLRSLIEAQLKKETQNPQLLLAQATLYPRNSRDYKALYDKGFELARRLQDAAALQAFREEDWFAAQDLTRQTLGPQIGNLDDLDMGDILGMAQQIFGREVPPEILAQLIPELLAEMEDSDEFEEDEDPFFLPLPFSGRRKKSAKKKSRFPF
jgi:hypothetical protein